jgi:tetratricopeptide (TPR) repeat protein
MESLRAFVTEAEWHAERVHGPQGHEHLAWLERKLDGLRAAQEALAGTEDRFAARTALAIDALLAVRGSFDRRLDALDAGLAAARRAGDGGLVARVELARGFALGVRGRARGSHAALESALAHARAARDLGVEADVLRIRGALGSDGPNLADAQACLERALALYRQLGDRHLAGCTLTSLGIVHFSRGRLEQARHACEDALAIHERCGDERAQASAHGNLAILRFWQGDLPAALAHAEATLVRLRRVGDFQREAIALANVARLRHHQGQFRAAELGLRRALRLHCKVGDRASEGATLCALAELRLEQRRHDDAREALERALAICRETSNQRFEAVALGTLGILEHLAGNLGAARRQLADAAERFGAAPNPNLLFLSHLAAVTAAAGSTDAARILLDRAGAQVKAALDPGLDAAHEVLAAMVEGAPLPPPVPRADSNFHVRIAIRVACARPHRPGPASTPSRPGLAITIGPEAGFVRAPGGARVDLARRGAMRRILCALARRHGESAAPLSIDELFAAGWPGQRILPEAQRQRVYDAILMLRKLGLRKAIVRTDAGYQLDPGVVVSGAE